MSPPLPRPRAPLRVVTALLLPILFSVLFSSGGMAASETARRIVSLNPSLTEILMALGAADSLVGVDDYSARAHPSLAQLPQVGGLFNPSLEAVLALTPASP